jgi:hypothetical protein
MRIYGSRLEFVYSCRAAEQFIVILTYAPFYRAKFKQAGEIQQHQGLYIPSFSYLENSAKSSDTQHHSQSGHYRFRYKNIGTLPPVKPDKNLANLENAHAQRVLHRPAFVVFSLRVTSRGELVAEAQRACALCPLLHVQIYAAASSRPPWH